MIYKRGRKVKIIGKAEEVKKIVYLDYGMQFLRYLLYAGVIWLTVYYKIPGFLGILLSTISK